MNEPKKPTAVAVTHKPSALDVMASRYSVERSKLLDTMKATVFQGATNEELLALVVVANQYGLNPFTREIYAFPKKGGGIQPVVSIDGWIRLMNDQENFDGIEFSFTESDGDRSCTATIHVKGRAKPVSVTEYQSECSRNTDPWKTCPRRMLRHKALIQCARVAFGFSGITDEDDGRVIAESDPDPLTKARNITPAAPALTDAVQTQGTVSEPTTTPQDRIAEALGNAGHSFDDLAAWLSKSKNHPDPSSLGGFDDLPAPLATRLTRNLVGIIGEIAAIKAGGAQ